MDGRVRSQLRRELSDLLGPRRFLAQEGHSHRLGVVLPQTVHELQQVVRLTSQAKVPLIPRGGTTNAFAGIDPDDGLVISFEGLGRIRRVSAKSQLASVEPGVIWRTLSETLAEQGLMPRVYPSSEGFSTVGGFIAQGGLGIGSYEFGDAGQNVASVRLVDAKGELHALAKDDLDLVVGAQGRTGLVVEVQIRLQELTALAQQVALFNSFAAAEQAIAEIATQAVPIWSVNLLDEAGVALQSGNWPDLAVPSGTNAALFTFHERDTKAVASKMTTVIGALHAELLDVRGAVSRRLTQFASLQILRTTPIPMQFQMPLGRAAELANALSPEIRDMLAVEAVAGQAGRSIAVRFYFRVRQTVEVNATVARVLLGLAESMGGVPYTTGATYLDQAQAVFGAEKMQRLSEFRRLIDPEDRLNPGRGFLAA